MQWNDIDYMEEYRDFTYDKTKFAGLPEFVEDLHSKGMHYVLMIVSFPFAIVYRFIYFFIYQRKNVR